MDLAERVAEGFLVTHPTLSRAVTKLDLVQECLAHWWQRRAAYDGARGASRRTFMRNVLRARLQDIERAERAGKRGGGVNPLSLERSILPGEADSEFTLADLVRDDDPEADPQEAARRSDLRRHVERVLRQLPERQQALADGLRSGRSMSELSRSFRVPRPTLYDELRRIRDVFRDEGLEEYLH